MLLLIHSASHLLVDALCAATIFSAGGGDLTTALLLYNTLAFSSQCLVGLAADRVGRHSLWCGIAMLTIAAGFFLPLPLLAKAAVVGVGNSVFHVTAGVMTLNGSCGRAWRLGIFVAPGCIGVTLGTLFPQWGMVFGVLMLLFAGLVLFCGAGQTQTSPHATMGKAPQRPMLIALLLTCAVGVRALGGSAAAFTWNINGSTALWMTLFVFAGKAAGGFLCDRVGAQRSALLSIPIAALLTAFCSHLMLPALIGQFALNLTMPLTLWLIYAAMPDAPGFSFGLAASALWPGTLLGSALAGAGSGGWVWIILCFSFSLWSISFSDRSLSLSAA